MENIFFKKSTLCQPCHHIIALTDQKRESWDEMVLKAPLLPRGWFELATLSFHDRIEFTRLYWHSQWHFPPKKRESIEEGIDQFFDKLLSIDMFLVQNTPKSVYLPLMLYQKENGQVFFASPPASLQAISRIRCQFSHLALPDDYLSFFSIHDGFQRTFDGGLITLRDFPTYYNKFQERLSIRPADEVSLVPFCELESVHHMQCFFKHTHTFSSVGNLYFDFLHGEAFSLDSKLIFETFSEWLLHYVYS